MSAAFLRFYQLSSWPPIHVDEAIGSRDALDLFTPRVDLLQPSLTHYLPASLLPLRAVFEITGESLWASRALSALFGLGAVGATAWAGWVFFGRTAGLVAGVVLGASHVAVAISRFGGPSNSQAVFLAALCLATYAQAQKSGGRWWIVWGAVTGLGVYTYEGFRILPLVIVLGLLITPRFAWKQRIGLAQALAAFVVVASPFLFEFVQRPGFYLEESSKLSVLGSPGMFKEQYQTDSILEVIREQFKISFRYLFEGRNRDTQYGFRGAGFAGIMWPLFIAGVVVAVVRVRQLSYRTVLLWFWLGLLVGSAMTESPPLAPRISMVFPAAALLCAGALGPALDRLDGLDGLRSGPVLKMASAALLGVALFVPNYQNYFSKYSEADIFWPWVEPNRSIGEHLAHLDTETQVLVFRTPAVYQVHPILDFLRRTGPGSDVKVVDVEWQADNFDLQGTMRSTLSDGPVELIFTKEGEGLIARIQRLCPAAKPQVTTGPLESADKPDTLFIAIPLTDARCLTGTPEGGR